MKIIGILTRIEYLDHAWKYFCNEPYIEVCQRYHWQPILLCSIQDATRLVSICDALLLPGGYDVASCYFQQPPHPNATTYAKGMDHLEFAMIDAFVKAKKPILGICRGMQTLNVYFKGTLCQDFATKTHEEEPHVHPIKPCPNTIFEQLLLPNSKVNSYHHQCVDELAPCLCLGALSKDHRIEAFVHEEYPIMAIQWHPEKLEDDTILPYFFDVFARI